MASQIENGKLPQLRFRSWDKFHRVSIGTQLVIGIFFKLTFLKDVYELFFIISKFDNNIILKRKSYFRSISKKVKN